MNFLFDELNFGCRSSEDQTVAIYIDLKRNVAIGKCCKEMLQYQGNVAKKCCKMEMLQRNVAIGRCCKEMLLQPIGKCCKEMLQQGNFAKKRCNMEILQREHKAK